MCREQIGDTGTYRLQERGAEEERRMAERLRSAEAAQYESRQRLLRDLDAVKVGGQKLLLVLLALPIIIPLYTRNYTFGKKKTRY